MFQSSKNVFLFIAVYIFVLRNLRCVTKLQPLESVTKLQPLESRKLKSTFPGTVDMINFGTELMAGGFDFVQNVNSQQYARKKHCNFAIPVNLKNTALL